MARLLLIRHAHTAGNGPAMTLSGWTDLPVSEEGRRQIALLRNRLLGDCATPFEVIYTSPLQRAHDTAWALAEAGLGPLVADDALREIDCGDVDGIPVDEVKGRLPEVWEANLRQDNPDFRWPGGESYRELRRRCLIALARIACAHPGGRIAVVTHAGVISQILGAMHGVSPARWELYRPANTALTEIDWSGERPVLVRFDDHAHLNSRTHPPSARP